MLEGYSILSALAARTSTINLGLLVGGVTYRNPALVAKIATTLDIISSGRAVLGIGAAWFEEEHKAYGFEFPSLKERFERLEDALQIFRLMFTEDVATFSGKHFSVDGAFNNPKPIRGDIPILIGGSGERKTLRTVARYADAWNTGGDIEKVRRKDAVLRSWCEEVGRDHTEIERTLQAGNVVIRDDAAEGRRAKQRIARQNRGWAGPEVVTVQQLVDRLAPFRELGFHHFYWDSAAPYDEETLERLVRDVKPGLETAGTPIPVAAPV